MESKVLISLALRLASLAQGIKVVSMRISHKKIFLSFIIAAGVAVGGFVYAAGSNICQASGTSAICTATEVGPFMQGITIACGNDGTCSLTDITQVFNNVGNWILGIIGALVFLMYIIGGFYFLLSGVPGMEKFREKGKTAIKTSTVGLIIVFFSFAGLQTLQLALRSYGEVGSNTGTYVACYGDGTEGGSNDGDSCGANMKCGLYGNCQTGCEQIDEKDPLNSYSCINTSDPTNPSATCGGYPDQCPGGKTVQCCILN